MPTLPTIALDGLFILSPLAPFVQASQSKLLSPKLLSPARQDKAGFQQDSWLKTLSSQFALFVPFAPFVIQPFPLFSMQYSVNYVLSLSCRSCTFVAKISFDSALRACAVENPLFFLSVISLWLVRSSSSSLRTADCGLGSAYSFSLFLTFAFLLFPFALCSRRFGAHLWTVVCGLSFPIRPIRPIRAIRD